MDKIHLYHALSEKEFDINNLFKANIVKTHKKIIIISGGKRRTQEEVSVILLEDDDEFDSLSQ